MITRNLFRDDILRDFLPGTPSTPAPGARVAVLRDGRFVSGLVETVADGALRVRTRGGRVDVLPQEVVDLGVRWRVVEGGRP